MKLNTCQDGNVHTHAKTYELKKKKFTLNSQNIKQVIGIQGTFILETKLQQLECAFVYHDQRTEKEGIHDKQSEQN